MAAVRGGGDRQMLHEVIREHSLAAWAALQDGQANPMAQLLAADPRITDFVPAATIPDMLDTEHVGDARAVIADLAQIEEMVEMTNAH
ncbi:MAG: hypothetical protein R2867_43415 [Caldilineaceae bacterium]